MRVPGLLNLDKSLDQVVSVVVVVFLFIPIYSLNEPCVSLYYSEKLTSSDMVRLNIGKFTMG
jgi:hypothetical protein